jgi:transcriptional antiterminator RfaH
MPVTRLERIRRRKTEIYTEPLFPRYIFIDLDSSSEGKSWSPIRSTLGVQQMVRFGNHAAKVDNALTAALRAPEQTLPEQKPFQNRRHSHHQRGPFRKPRSHLPNHQR